MASTALTQWRSSGLARLTELEAVHAQATGPASGRRWGTTQLNRSLLVTLVAQFQGYCRGLHDEAVDVHVAHAAAGHAAMLRTLLTQNRVLDTGNPRRGALGSDFGKLGFSFIDDLKAAGPMTAARLDDLEVLIDYRNAVGHGDEAKVRAVESARDIRSTKGSYLRYRGRVDALAGTMDRVVAGRLSTLLGIPKPW